MIVVMLVLISEDCSDGRDVDVDVAAAATATATATATDVIIWRSNWRSVCAMRSSSVSI